MIAPPNKNRTAAPARQRGSVLLILALVMVLGGAWVGIKILGRAKSQAAVSERSLVVARDALLGATAAMAVFGTFIGPGRLPTPDFLDPGEGPANYDGDANGFCAQANWTIGNSLPVVGGTLPADIRCFGRLPWATLGLGEFGSMPQADPGGVVPWYAMSANLASGCITAINPALLNTTYTPFPPGTCKTVAQPFPWLTVRDYKGNILTTRAAFVLILPGPVLGAQNRPGSPLQGPAAYLDSVTVTVGCAQPCVPGAYNNARFNWPNNVGLSFIQCAPPGIGTGSDASFTQPYLCNDRILYVTIEEFMEVAERRALQYAADRLQAYFTLNTYYPYAAPHNPAAAGGFGQCQNGLIKGLIAHVKETNAADANRCTHPPFDFESVAPLTPPVAGWFKQNKWGEYIYYAVAADCTQATPTCATSVATLSAGAVTNARALVIATGAPIIAAPFAASKGGAQAARPSANIADYLDSTENSNGDNRFDAPTTPLARGYNDKTLVVAP